MLILLGSKHHLSNYCVQSLGIEMPVFPYVYILACINPFFLFFSGHNILVKMGKLSPLQTRKYMQSYIKPGLTMIDIW